MLDLNFPMDSTNPDDLLSRRTDHLKIVKQADGSHHAESEPRLFLNRELSWLAFNERVLEEARDPSLPLYERLKFLGIVSSNFDEFFMIRVAGLKQQILGEILETPADGMTPVEQMSAIGDKVHALVAEQDRIWREELRPQLAAAGISFLTADSFTSEQRAFARNHFAVNVFPALTPLAVDPGHPFPHLRNRSLNLAVILAKSQGKRRTRTPPKEQLLAVVQVPMVLGRIVRLPSSEAGKTAYTLLGELIAAFAGDLFPGYDVKQTAMFRVTRNSDLLVDDEESEDLLSTMQEELRRRELGAAVRLELADSASPDIERWLGTSLKIDSNDIYRISSPFQMQDLLALEKLDPRPELRVEPLVPATPSALRDPEAAICDVVKKGDILLHHPYESYDPVVRFVEEAADDPQVLALKMTLYRTSGGDSPFVRALSRAAQNGKQVAALVEIKARFDEANNIAWARRLEENGVHVVYGLIGYKTHCKVTLVVRREADTIRRYVHVGTGNYHPTTARQYTDLSFLTARPEIAEDASALFNFLTGYSEPPHWKRFAVAPFDLQTQIVAHINKQTERAKRGEPSRIIAKMNSLVDPAAIRALYAASQAGVDIDLLVRGICCLRAGVPGLSERIRVVSVVDRFLEHSRVFAFGAPEACELYIASADWMPRNFVRRIEIMCPIEDPALKARLLSEVLGTPLRDNVKARVLQADGTYARMQRPGPPLRSQQLLLDAARGVAATAAGTPALASAGEPRFSPPEARTL
jgi:polyphosphate kinase